MFQLGYTGLTALPLNSTYVGGLRRFWYLPIEDVAAWPRVNAANQHLVAEPQLKPGKAWFGPIDVPRNKLGYTETAKRTKAGPYWEIKVDGTYIGESQLSRIQIGNMLYHRYLVVGQVRAGGYFLLFGSPDCWLDFTPEVRSGNGPDDTTMVPLSFSTESVANAFILPSFTSATIGQAIGATPGGSTTMNQKEIIYFADAPQITIPWTPARLAKFGQIPAVQVWLQEGTDPPFLANAGSIELDAPPPSTTEIRVNLGGNPTGFILIE